MFPYSTKYVGAAMKVFIDIINNCSWLKLSMEIRLNSLVGLIQSVEKPSEQNWECPEEEIPPVNYSFSSCLRVSICPPLQRSQIHPPSSHSHLANSLSYIHMCLCVCVWHIHEYMYCVINIYVQFSSVHFSHSVVSDSRRPHGLQHTRLPCPSPKPGACSNSCPLSRWCHATISSSVVPFFSCLQSFPASGYFPMSQFFTSGGQSIGVLALASVLPMNISLETDFL